MTPGNFWVRVYTSNVAGLQSIRRAALPAGFWTRAAGPRQAGPHMFTAKNAGGSISALAMLLLFGCSRAPAGPQLVLRAFDWKTLEGEAPLGLSGEGLPSGAPIEIA